MRVETHTAFVALFGGQGGSTQRKSGGKKFGGMAEATLANKEVVPIITSGSAQAALANFIMKIERFTSASRSRETTWSICLTQRDKYRIGHQSGFSAYQVLRRSVRLRQDPSDNQASL
jgi:hypothetical protein